MSEPSAEQVVEAYLAAIAARDFERARACLADDGFSYRSPIASFDDADAFIADIWHVGPILEGIDCRRSFVDGDEVCSILDFKTRMDRLEITPVVQWATVRDGRIRRIEAFFDASRYAAMFVGE